MAMPMNNDEVNPDDGGAERTTNVTDYKRTCIDFIEDISGSYLEWVDYYSDKNQIDKDEDKKRRNEITGIVKKTNTWLAKVPTSIKAVDVVMNDGIQKMAEATAGKPFQIGVFINKISEYTNRIIDNFDIDCVGISTAGQVDSEQGIITYANENLPDFTGCRLADDVEKSTGLKTFAENDANCAAIGEMWMVCKYNQKS